MAFSLGDVTSAPERPWGSSSSSSLDGAQDLRAPGFRLLTSWHQDLLNISGWKVPLPLPSPPLNHGHLRPGARLPEVKWGRLHRWHLEMQNPPAWCENGRWWHTWAWMMSRTVCLSM